MLGSKCLRLITGVGAVAMAGLTSPQSQHASPQQPPFVVRATTQLVQVNAIAVDSHGHPVLNLAIDDFKLTDNGKPQTISVFSIEKSEPSAAPSSSQPPPRGLFSNRSEQTSRTVTVILVDDLNPDGRSPTALFGDLAYSRQEIRKFLQQMGPQDYVALYAMGNELTVLHDFTNDSAALIGALDRFNFPPPPADVTPAISSGTEETAQPLNTQLLRETQQLADAAEAGFSLQRRVDGTAGVFQQIAGRLAVVPGRKALVWFTAAFPSGLAYPYLPDRKLSPLAMALDPGALSLGFISRDLERGAQAFNNANMAIYPIDVRGLITSSGSDASAESASNARSPFTPAEGQDEIGTMLKIAEQTGGRAFFNTNGLAQAIGQALDDGRVTYTLGYYPVDVKWDSTFHAIHIKLTKPGIRLRYRRGYFALPLKQADPSDRRRALTAAALSPLDATGIGVTVQAARGRLQGVEAADLQLTIDSHALHFEAGHSRWNGEIELAVLEIDAQGQVLKAFDQTRTMKFKPETYATVEREGLRFPVRLRILPGSDRIRLVVRDNSSGALGSVNLLLSQLPSS